MRPQVSIVVLSFEAQLYSELNSLSSACSFGYEYDRTYYEETAVTQHDWVCDKDLYVTNTFVFNRLGEVVGTLIIGTMGDL